MPYQALASVRCVILMDFNDLLAIAFGINLALPIFRELVVLNRRPIDRRLPAIESILTSRIYTNPCVKQGHLAALSRVKVRLIACDQELAEKINLCSVITFMFAAASLCWIAHGVYNRSCLDHWLVFLAVWLNFLPLPASLLYLTYNSRSLFREVNRELDMIQQELM